MRWPVVAIAVGCTTVAALPAFLTAALAVQIRVDLDLGVATIGALFGIYFGVGALGSPFLGRVVDRIGWPTGIRIAGSASGLVLVGMATIASNVTVIALLFIAGGLAAVIANTSANRALARSVPAERYGILFGLKHTAVPTATLLGGLAVPVFGLTIGWQWAFATGAVLAAILVASVPNEHTERRTARPDGPRPRPTTPLIGLVLLGAVAALGIAAIDSVTSFLVSYAVEEGISESSAGLLLGAASVVGLVTRLAGGFLIAG
ncbi:MFS transporter, partial [bacterium]|nr:MFS transporter [bacterium]